jgi:hypothetical protein
MAAAASDLTTLANALVWLGCPSDDAHGTLQRLITAVSVAIQNGLGRDILSQDHVEVFDGRGRFRIMMPDFPITAVQSVTIGELDQVSVPPRSQASPGYTFSDKCVYVDPPYLFEKGRRNVRIAYTAGYATVPPDIEQGCLIWIKAIMDSANYSAALKSATAGQTKFDWSFALTKLSNLTVLAPPAVLSMLASYKRVSLGW